MEWLDSRVYKPSCSRYDRYIVNFNSFSDFCAVGLAEWIPTENYTNGYWGKITHMNGNEAEGTVLYWMQHPKRAKLVFEK